MYTDHVIGPDEHESWLAKTLSDESSQVLIFEAGGKPVGVVSFTEISPLPSVGERTASWGFYIGDPESPRGLGTIMGILAIDNAFGVLHLGTLSASVLGSNVASLAFHGKLGFRADTTLSEQVLKSGVPEDVVLLSLLASDWPEVRSTVMQGYGG